MSLTNDSIDYTIILDDILKYINIYSKGILHNNFLLEFQREKRSSESSNSLPNFTAKKSRT